MKRRLLAGALVLASLLAVVPAAPAAAAGSVSVVVAPLNGGVLGSGDVGVDVTVTNTGTTPLRAGRLAFSVDRVPVAGPSVLLDALRDPSRVLLGYAVPRASRSTPALAPGAAATVRTALPHDQVAGIFGPDPQNGARLMWVRYRDGAETVQQVAESAVVRMGRGSGRMGLGAVIPVVAPAGTEGVVRQDQQDVLARSGGAWSDAVEAARAMPSATIALDPEVPASIRLAGDAAPASARTLLEDLQGLPNPVLLLPYGDRDVALERAAGVPSTLVPTSFDGVSTAPTTGASSSPAPTASPAPAAPVSELTAWSGAGGTLRWPVAGAATPAAARAAGDGETVVVSSADVRDTPQRAAAGPAARLTDGSRALVADAAASDLLRRAAAGGTAGDAALAPLVGLLATDLVSGTAPSVLAVVDRGATTAGLARALRVLDQQTWIEGRGAPAFAAGKTAQVALRPEAVPSSRVATARALVAGDRSVGDLGSALQDGGVVTGPQRLALLALLSAGWRGQDAAWSTAAEAVQRGFRHVLGQVQIAPGAPRFAGGIDGTLTAVVQNALPRPITVDVTATASNSRLRFNADGPTRVAVPANASKTVDLPFRSITNGSTEVTLRLATPRGTALGSPSTREVTVRAGFDTVVAVVLLLLLGALLALGVYRNVRRRTRKRLTTAA